MSEAKAQAKESLHDNEEEQYSKVVPSEGKESNVVDGGPALVEMAQRFFYEDESFGKTFEQFAEDHCDIFNVDDEEMKLEYDKRSGINIIL